MLWLCWNCTNEKGLPGKPFEGDLPVCPCGVDGRLAEYKPYVVKREVIHYDPPHDVLKSRGVRKHACDGVEVGKGPMASGHPAAVTCPKCQATEAYRAACALFGEPVVEAKADFAVS